MKKFNKVLTSTMAASLVIQSVFFAPILAHDNGADEMADVEVDETNQNELEEETVPESLESVEEGEALGMEESEEPIFTEESSDDVIEEAPVVLAEKTAVEQVQEKIDALPSLSEYTVSQRESVKEELQVIRAQMRKLSLAEEKALDTTKLVNLETAVQMEIKAIFYKDENIGDVMNIGNPVKIVEDSELIFQDLGNKVLAMPVFENDTQYLATVGGAGKRHDTYVEIGNSGQRNETHIGLSFTKGKTWNAFANAEFRIGVKTNYMQPITVKENVDGTWGKAIYEKSLSLVMNQEMDIVPKTIEGYTYHGYKTLDYHHVDGNIWEGTPGISEWIPMDMTLAGLSQPNENGVMHWKSSLTASGYRGYIYTYYSMIRNVEYNANGGTGTMESSQYVSKEKVTVLDNAFQRDGYHFVGWNTKADGSGTSYTANDVFEMPYVETLTLYAQWDKVALPPVSPQPGNSDSSTPQQQVVTQDVVDSKAPVEESKESKKQEVSKETEVVEEETTPLAKMGNWALVNLISMVLTVLAGILLLLSRHKKEETEELEDEETVVEIKKRRRWTKVVGAIVAVVSVIVFFLTEDLRLNMVMTDRWTIWMVLILLVEVVVLILGKWWKKEEPEEENE